MATKGEKARLDPAQARAGDEQRPAGDLPAPPGVPHIPGVPHVLGVPSAVDIIVGDEPETRVEPRAVPVNARALVAEYLSQRPPQLSDPSLLRPEVTREQPGRYTPVQSDSEASGAPLELGRGGLGRVAVALDGHVGREVAVKESLLADESQSPLLRERLILEGRITGQLEHPNIVPVYELGIRDDDSIYYTMRIVRGRTLAEALQQAQSLPERLRLLPHFERLCHAIAYAHSRGVVHRDIKPSNVMIGEFGETVVIDWGVAKIIGSPHDVLGERAVPIRLPENRDLPCTQIGTVLGTPQFLAPELLTEGADAASEQTDLWALGVVLYRILCGRYPYRGTKTAPVTLSILTEGAERPTIVEPGVPVELEAVVLKALERDRSKRYPSVRDLVHDVEAFRAGHRVEAHTYSLWDLVRRFVSRNRIAVGVAAVALVGLAFTTAASYMRVVRARDRALAAEKAALKSADESRQHLAGALLERAKTARRRGDADAARAIAAHALALREDPAARGLLVATRSGLLPRVVDELEGTNCPHGVLLATGRSRCASGPLASAAGLLATHDGNGIVRAQRAGAPGWDVVTSCPTISVLAWSPDEDRLVVACEREVQIWQWNQPHATTVVGIDGRVTAAAWTGQGLLVGTHRGKLVKLDRESRTALPFAQQGGTIRSIAAGPTGSLVAVGGLDRSVHLRSLETGELVRDPLPVGSPVSALQWGPRGRQLFVGLDDGDVLRAELRSGDAMDRLVGRKETVRALHLDAKDERLSVLYGDGWIRVWEWNTPREANRIQTASNVLAIASTTKELLVAGVGADGLRVYDRARGERVAKLPVSAPLVRVVSVSPDGTRAVVGGSDGSLVHWDLHRRMPLAVITAHHAAVRGLAWDAAGERLVSGSKDHGVAWWAASNDFATAVGRVKLTAPVRDLDGAGQLTAVALEDGRVGWIAPPQKDHAGSPLTTVTRHRGWAAAVATTREGDLLSIGQDGTLRRNDEVMLRVSRPLHTLALSPGQQWAAVGDSAGSIHVVDLATGVLRAVYSAHDGVVRSLSFVSDPVLASGGDDGLLRLWRLDDLTKTAASIEREVSRALGLRVDASGVVHRYGK